MRKPFAALFAVTMLGFATDTSQAAVIRTDTDVRSLVDAAHAIPLTTQTAMREARDEVQLVRHFAPRHHHHHHGYAPQFHYGHGRGAYYRGYGYPGGYRSYGYGGGYYAPPCHTPYPRSGFSLYLGF